MNLKPIVVIVSGKQGSGKSSLCYELSQRLGLNGIVIKFAEPLYRAHYAVLNTLAEYRVPVDPNAKNGYLLQELGRWGRDRIAKDVWATCTANAVNEMPSSMIALVEDTRFENEFDIMTKFPHHITIRLDAPESIRQTRTNSWRENTMDISETNLDEYARRNKFQFYFDTNSMPTSAIADRIMERIDQIKQQRQTLLEESNG